MRTRYFQALLGGLAIAVAGTAIFSMVPSPLGNMVVAPGLLVVERVWPEGIHTGSGVAGLFAVFLLQPTLILVTAVAWSVPIFAVMSAWAAIRTPRGRRM